MCGIVGYVGQRPARGIVVDALRRMEYRGYDSSGVALIDGNGGLTVRRRAGRLANLEAALAETDDRQPRRQHRPRPHPLGHPRQAHRPQRPPAPRRRRQDRGRPQRDHRELRRAAHRTGSRRRRVRQRHRHRGRRAPGLPAVPPRRHRRRLRGLRAGGAAPAGGPLHAGRSPTPTSRARSSPPAAPRRWSSESATARCSSAPMSPHSSNTPATPSNSVRTRRWCVTADGYRITDFHGNRRRPDFREVPYRLGPVGRRKGRLRVLHAQGDRRAARRGRGHAARPLRRRPHRARRAAPVRPGAARDRQGVRRRLRHRLSLRAAGQVRDRALDAAARRGRAGQRIPLPRPGSGSATRSSSPSRSPARPPTRSRRCGTPRSRRPRCWRSATPTVSQIPRECDAVLYTRAGPEIGVASTKTFLAQIAANYLVGLALAQARGTKYPDEVEREYRDSGGDARPGRTGTGDRRNPSPRWPTGSPSRRRCCSSAATSATPSRSKVRSSSRNWRTCTPRASPRASSSTDRSR